MQKMRVGVLRGGISTEYPVSLKTGEAVLTHLDENKYKPVDVFIDRSGVWHIGGFPIKPSQVSREVDVVFNALHGEYGEDGKVQRELEQFHVPYTGSRAIPSAIAMNKGLAKHCFSFYGIKTPRSVTVRESDDVHEKLLPFFREVSGAHVVKPLGGGSSLGVSVTRNFEELFAKTEETLNGHGAVLIEEHINGREVTCGVVEGAKGKTYPLFPIEIIHNDKGGFWDYDAKYSGRVR
jgi:D-alanine-D-alanine ligase